MQVPEQWRDYPCAEYFRSQLAIDGYWDEPGQIWLIEPSDRISEDTIAEFLQVGRPGVDDVGFGYRKAYPGFWAYHRMVDQDFQFLAPSIQEFLQGWFSGRITI